MAQLRDYLVSFSPATITDFGFSVAISLMSGNTKHAFKAAGMAEMQAEVRRLALEYGKTCAPYVTVPRGQRNPPGFDKACNEIQVIKVPA